MVNFKSIVKTILVLIPIGIAINFVLTLKYIADHNKTQRENYENNYRLELSLNPTTLNHNSIYYQVIIDLPYYKVIRVKSTNLKPIQKDIQRFHDNGWEVSIGGPSINILGIPSVNIEFKKRNLEN